MDTKTNEEVVKEIVDKRGKVDIQTEMNDLFGNYNPEIQEVSDDFSFSTPSSEVMIANRNGVLSGRYENYIGGTNNEDRLARQQGFGEKAWNGIVRNTAKAGIYAAQTAVSLTYGLASALAEGDVSKIFDNDAARMLDDGVEALNTDFALYYSDEEKSKSLLGKLGTANFWFDQVGDGLAFIGGAVLPSVILAPFTGGISLEGLGASVGRVVGKAAFKKTLRQSLVKGLERTAAEKAGMSALAKGLERTAAEKAGMSALRKGVRRGAKIGDGIYDTAKTAKYVAQSTFFESGMEARHAMKSAMEEFSLSYQQNNNGDLPGIEEISEYYKDAESMADGVFWGNVALLSVTSLPMLGGAFGLNKIGLLSGAKKSMNKFGNRIIGLGIKDAKKGGRELIKATKAQKILGTGYKILKKPIAEGTEEMLQNVISDAGQMYLESKYDDNSEIDSIFGAYAESFKKTYTSQEGWEAFMVGAVVGGIGGIIPAGAGKITKNKVDAFEGFGESSYNAVSKRLEDNYNVVQEFEKGAFQKFNRANSVANSKNYNIPSDTDVVATMHYIKAAEGLKGYSDMKKDYFAAVDGLEIPQNAKDDFGITSDEQILEYKEGLKKDFDSQYDLYKKGTEFADALDLDGVTIEGNKTEMKEAVTLMTMLGGENGLRANEYSDVIAKMTGESGTVNAVRYQDEVISPRLKDTKKKFRRINDRINAVSAEMIKEGNKASTAETPEKQKESAKKQRLLVTKLSELRDERDALSEVAKVEIESVATKFGIKKGQETLPDIDTIIKQEEVLELYIKSLEVGGRKGDAASLKYMLSQYKNHAVAASELDTFTQRLVGSDFFKGKEGKKLMKSWLGDEYKDRQDFIDFVEANEQEFSDKFGKYFVNPQQVVDLLSDNEGLSDREKFKLESIMRTHMTYQNLKKNAEEASENFLNTGAEEVLPTDMDNVTRITAKSRTKVQGDTVTLGRKVTLDPTKSSPEQLRNYINEVSEQIDEIGGKPLGDQVKEIADKRKELRKLQADLVDLESREVSVEVSPQELEQIKLEINNRRENDIEQRRNRERKPLDKGAERIAELQDKYEKESNVKEKEKIAILLLNEIARFRKNSSTGHATKAEVESLNSLEKQFKEEYGLEIVSLLGETYDERRITNVVTFTTGKTEGEVSIYNKEIRPQVNKNGVMVQQGSYDVLQETSQEEANQSVRPTESKIPRINEKYDAEITQAEQEFSEQEGQPATEEALEFGREQVQELESEIEELEAPLQFINTKDFETYSKLYKNKERTEDEQAQFEELSEQMDNWAHIAGTVTDGVQLTDVIDQLLNIEETETVKDNVTTEVTTEEVSQAEKSVSSYNNYDVALNQSAVTAVRKDNKTMEVAGLTKDGLAAIVGEEIANEVGEHETKNTLIIPEDVIKEINAQGNLIITDVIDGNPSVFSIVYETITGLDGTPQTRPLESDYIVDSTQEGVNDFGINEEALYAVKKGDELGFKVDDESEYNKKLLDEASEEMSMERPYSEQEKESIAESETIKRINSEENIKNGQQEIQDLTEELNQEDEGGESNLEEVLDKAKKRINSIRGKTTKGTPVTKSDRDAKIDFDGLFKDISKGLNATPEIKAALKKELKSYLKITHPDKTQDEGKKRIGEAYSTAMIELSKLGKEEKVRAVFEEYKKSILEYDASKKKSVKEVKDYKKTLEGKIKRITKRIEDRKKEIKKQELGKANKLEPNKLKRLSKETKEKLRNTLRIYVVNKEGQQVNVLKGIRPENDKAENETKEKFEALRAEITDNLEAIVSAYYAGESVEIASKVTAERVFPGQLNLNLTQTETGVAREIKTFDKAMSDKIDDIGYVENGELKTKNGTKVDETLFLGKTIENSKGTEGKTPFVVFERGGRRIAYPVKVSRKAPPVTSEQVTAVFNNQTLTDVQKAMEVNKLLAQAGFDLNEANNAVVVLREGTLTEETIQAVTDKLASKDYISSVDGWTSKQTTIEQDLSGNASIDIDTSRPFLSPKLQMDLSSIKVAEKVKTNTAKKKNSKSTVVGGDVRSRVRNKQAQDKMCD